MAISRRGTRFRRFLGLRRRSDDDLGGGPQLTDASKALAIGLANVFSVVVVGLCLKFGFTDKAGKQGYSPPYVGWLIIVEGVIIIVSFAISRLADITSEAFWEMGSDADDEEAVPAAENARFEVPPWLRRGGLWVITIGSFLAAGLLTQGTGGIVDSPFRDTIVALIVLSPNLMTGRRTPYAAMIGGLLYYAVLLRRAESAPDLPNPPSDTVYLVVTGAIVLVSVGFLLWTRYVRRRTRQRRRSGGGGAVATPPPDADPTLGPTATTGSGPGGS